MISGMMNPEWEQLRSYLIIVVLIGLVIVFKKQINDLVTKIFKKITTDSNKIIGWDGSLHPFV